MLGVRTDRKLLGRGPPELSGHGSTEYPCAADAPYGTGGTQ